MQFVAQTPGLTCFSTFETNYGIEHFKPIASAFILHVKRQTLLEIYCSEVFTFTIVL